jgi:hypothetical protein
MYAHFPAEQPMSILDSSAAEKLAKDYVRNQMQRDAEWMYPENFRRLYEAEFDGTKFGTPPSSFNHRFHGQPSIYYSNGRSFVTYPMFGGGWTGPAITKDIKVTQGVELGGCRTTEVELTIVYNGDPFINFGRLGVSDEQFIENFLLQQVSIDSMLKRIHQKMKERNPNG